MRDLNDILHFRGDISPFLVHLTRTSSTANAGDNLKQILRDRKLVVGSSQVSDARFAAYTKNMSPEDRQKFFGAICFTETPINEIHCLLEIGGRSVNLEPYGLVFIKERCIERGVDPVIYINNSTGDKELVLQVLCSLLLTKPDIAAQILPLIALFGQKLTPKGSAPISGEVDFRWEREWRNVPVKGPFQFSEDDIFIGLCPHDRIEEYDRLWKPIEFIDPQRNMKWYAKKLIDARQRTKLKYSVV